MTKQTFPRTLLLALSLLMFAGAALTALGSDAPAPTVQSALDESALEAVAAPTCGALEIAPMPMLFEIPPVVASKDGCSNSSCDASCRAEGYDYGICFQTVCVCRFWLP